VEDAELNEAASNRIEEANERKEDESVGGEEKIHQQLWLLGESLEYLRDRIDELTLRRA